MSLVEEASVSPNLNRVRWAGYGLLLPGLLAMIAGGGWPGPVTAGIDIVVALLPVLIALYAPRAFEVTSRGKQVFNFSVGGLAVLLFLLSFGLDLVDVAAGWVAAGVGAFSGALAAFLATLRQPVAMPKSMVIAMFIIGGVYGIGAFNVADVRFDTGLGTVYRAKVESMAVSDNNRTTSYSVDLAPWGPVTSSGRVDVPWSIYAALSPGDTACMTLHPGRFGARWFTPGVCRDVAQSS